MAFLRFVALLALAVWIGGLVALGGIAAPALFDVLETTQPVGGRELAGVLFGVILARFQYVALAMGALLVVSLALRAALGPRPRRTAIRMWTVVAMLAMSAVTSFVITPRIDAIRESVPGPIAALSPDNPQRILFGRLHAASSGLMLLTVVAGLGLVWIEMRDQH